MTSPNITLTFEREIDALGLAGRIDDLDARGPVSALELVVFRQGLQDRTRELTAAPPYDHEDFEPSPFIPEDLQERLVRAHSIGSRVADILVERART